MKQAYKTLLLLLLVFCLIGAFFLLKVVSNKQLAAMPAIAVEYSLYDEQIQALDHFISRYFLDQGLVQTNLKKTEPTKLASGEDMLSESVGLMLQYYVRTDQPEAFADHLTLSNEILMKNNGLYQWRYRKGQDEAVSAAVDDLRIIKALLLASDKWGSESYKQQASQLSRALLKHCIREGQLLAYDTPDAELAPLFYYDLRTIAHLARFDDKWEAVYRNAEAMIKHQKNAEFPFYEDSKDEYESYRMIENTLILLYLSEVKQLQMNELAWYKEELRKGGVFSKYDRQGIPQSAIESPAIYGILAQIAKNMDDKDLYQLACEKLKTMQHQTKDEYFGGFIDTETKDAYSFDQLMALLGY